MVLGETSNKKDSTASKLPDYLLSVDNLLQQPEVRDELLATAFVATQSRTEDRDKFLKRPPRFKFVSGFMASIYDPETLKVHEGKWSDYHSWIAKDNGLQVFDDSLNKVKKYTSGQVFILRASPQKIMILSALDNLTPKDFEAIINNGYGLMDPEYYWIVKQGDGILRIPSSLSR